MNLTTKGWKTDLFLSLCHYFVYVGSAKPVGHRVSLRSRFHDLSRWQLGTAVAAGFSPWRVRHHRVRPHIDSTSDQLLKIYLSFTEKKRQHCAHDETKPHKTTREKVIWTCLFLVRYSTEGDWRTWNRKFRISSWGELAMGQNCYHSPPLAIS